MRIVAVLLSSFFALALNAGAQLANVRTVYVFPMTGGLDQYLANRITNAGLFQVVMDPKKADALFTDRLGEGLESRLAGLYPEPPAPKPQPVAEAKPEADAKPVADAKPEAKSEAGKTAEKPKAASEERAPADAKPKEEPPAPHFSTFGKGKGTIFLVDGRNRTVLWSLYENPKGATSAAMDQTASRIVDRLKRDLKGK